MTRFPIYVVSSALAALALATNSGGASPLTIHTSTTTANVKVPTPRRNLTVRSSAHRPRTLLENYREEQKTPLSHSTAVSRRTKVSGNGDREALVAAV